MKTSNTPLLHIRSAKRTRENSPAIHRWDDSPLPKQQSVKRTTEISFPHKAKPLVSAARFTGSLFHFKRRPSSELLGYFQASASRTVILVVLCLTAAVTVLAQTATQPHPSPTPRRPLPKPVGGSRGFEQFAKRDASARLVAGAATREVLPEGEEGADSATIAYDRGDTDYAAGKYKDAVAEFSEAVRRQPDWVQAHYALALSLIETKELKEAIEEFKQVLKLNAKEELKILSFYNMGNAYADLGQYEEAIEAYQQAIKLNSESAKPLTLSKPHNNLGLAYAASNRIAEAIAEFNRAVQLNPDYAEAHYNLGVAYLQLGKKNKARGQQEILVKLKPDLASKLDALIKK